MSRSADAGFWAIAAAASAIGLMFVGLIQSMPVGLPRLEKTDPDYTRLVFVGRPRPPRLPSKLRPVGPTTSATTHCCFDCEPEPILAVLARLPNVLERARVPATDEPMEWFRHEVCVDDLVALGVARGIAAKLCAPET